MRKTITLDLKALSVVLAIAFSVYGVYSLGVYQTELKRKAKFRRIAANQVAANKVSWMEKYGDSTFTLVRKAIIEVINDI